MHGGRYSTVPVGCPAILVDAGVSAVNCRLAENNVFAADVIPFSNVVKKNVQRETFIFSASVDLFTVNITAHSYRLD